MEKKCWFCDKKNAVDDKVYKVGLRKQNNRKDEKIVEVPRCESCYEKHAKGDRHATIVLTALPFIVALLYFVVLAKVENKLLYIALAYVIAQQLLTKFLINWRIKIAAPHKSVCEVNENEEVADALEDGYVEKRRF